MVRGVDHMSGETSKVPMYWDTGILGYWDTGKVKMPETNTSGKANPVVPKSIWLWGKRWPCYPQYSVKQNRCPCTATKETRGTEVCVSRMEVLRYKISSILLLYYYLTGIVTN